MQISLLGLVALLAWVWVVRRDLDRAALFVAAMLPFGMFSIISLGGFSLLAGDFFAAMTIGVLTPIVSLRRDTGLYLSRAALPLILFASYAVFASFILVRAFSGTVDVFVFNRLYDGERVSVHFSGAKNPLGPSSANISQLAYILLAVAFFLFVDAVGRRKGSVFLIKGLILAGCFNVGLAILNMVGADPILSLIRTADYSLLADHKVMGLPRVIGGFAEASSFGGFSVAVGVFLLVYGLKSAAPKIWGLGLANLGFAALSLSSTGILGLAAASTVLGSIALTSKAIRSRKVIYGLAALGAVALMALAVGLFLAARSDQFVLGDILDRLLFSKLDTVSGRERMAMAMNGLEVFWTTHWLGAGAGSVMASGYIFAVLGAVGLPGAALLIWFFAAAFFHETPVTDTQETAARSASKIFLIVWLVVSAASFVTPSPGLLALYVAAIALNCGVQHAPMRLEQSSRRISGRIEV